MFGLRNEVYRNKKDWELRRFKKGLAIYSPETPMSKVLRYSPFIALGPFFLNVWRDWHLILIMLILAPIIWMVTRRMIFPAFFVDRIFFRNGKRLIKIERAIIYEQENEPGKIFVADNSGNTLNIYEVWEATDRIDRERVKTKLREYISKTESARMVDGGGTKQTSG